MNEIFDRKLSSSFSSSFAFTRRSGGAAHRQPAPWRGGRLLQRGDENRGALAGAACDRRATGLCCGARGAGCARIPEPGRCAHQLRALAGGQHPY